MGEAFLRVLNYIDSANVSFRVSWVDLMKEMTSKGVDPVLLCRPGGNMEKVAREQSIETYVWKPPIANFPAADVRYASLAKRISPDLVHTRLSNAANIASFWDRYLHIPTIAMLDGVYKVKYYRRADHYTACSQWVKDRMSARGLDPQKIDVVYNSVDTAGFARREGERLSFRKALSLPPDATVILGAGTFVHVKGFHILIEAFARLECNARDKKFHLLLVGDGPMRTEYEKQIECIGLSEKVTISKGYADDIRPWLWAADIFVLPSIQEPFGIIVLEAMAAGLPVIVTNDGGAKEIVADGESGFLIPSEDAEAMRLAVEYASNLSLNTKKMMLAKAQERLEYFTPTSLAERLMRVYQKVLRIS